MFLIVSALFAFTFGAVIGSFLNVVIHRVPIGESVVSPPSHCPTCGNGIRWYDNIPIISWALLGGQCRHCASRISPRYAAVEGLTGVLSAMLWIKLVGEPFSKVEHWAYLDPQQLLIPFFMYFAFVALCVAIAFIDLEHLIIPHELAIPGILVGVGASFMMEALFDPLTLMAQWPPITPMVSIIGAVLGAVSVIVIFVVYFVMRGVAGMGGGDVTLMALVGAWLGWPAVIFVFFAASIQGLIAVGIAHLFGFDDFLHDANELFEEDDSAAADKQEEATEDAQDAAAATRDAEEAPLVAASEEDAAEDVSSQEEAPAEATERDTIVEVIEDEQAGPVAIPFGPFIVLAALEHLYLGPLLPEAISMIYMYF